MVWVYVTWACRWVIRWCLVFVLRLERWFLHSIIIFILLPVKQISSSGFHCHLDDLVVVAPFLPGIQSVVTGTSISDLLHFSEPAVSFSFAKLNLPEDRGPPALCSFLS